VSTSSAPEQLNENAKLQLEKKLLSNARAIPATDYQANLKAYQRLAELRPESEVYERKVERYRSLLETQQNTDGSLRRR